MCGFITKEEPSGIIRINFNIDGDIKNKLSLIAGLRGLSSLLREITREWVYKNATILTPTTTVITYHREEIKRLEKHLIDMNLGE